MESRKRANEENEDSESKRASIDETPASSNEEILGFKILVPSKSAGKKENTDIIISRRTTIIFLIK